MRRTILELHDRARQLAVDGCDAVEICRRLDCHLWTARQAVMWAVRQGLRKASL